MFKKNIIIGCGPAGLQLGYYFNIINEEYVILEKSNIAGSFFDKFPHSDELISINKVHTGKDIEDFNLRHDWNSLLNNHTNYNFNNEIINKPINMKEITDKFFPLRNDMVSYLNLFCKEYNIKINYNINVIDIEKKDNIFYIKCDNNDIWTCEKLIIATGLSKPNIPKNIINCEKYIKHYSDYPKNYFLDSINLDKYKNKKVLILGNGNSAFEIGNILNNYCSNVIIIGRNKISHAFLTHYAGDLRSKYLSFHDTFLLKSQNGIDHSMCNCCDFIIIKHEENNNIYYKFGKLVNNNFINLYPNIFLYDEIINCTGWAFNNDVFNDNIKPLLDDNNKYPKMTSEYESINISNLYFIGALMHVFDKKRSSGGFIHGFRYLINNFIKINYTNFNYLEFNKLSTLTIHFLKRINTSSSLYQMFGQLCDIFYIENNKFIYYEHIPITYLFSSKNKKIIFPKSYIYIITLEYSNKKLEIVDIDDKKSYIGSENLALFLHPIIRVFNNFNNNFLSKFNETYFISSNKNYLSIEELVDHFDENIIAEFTLQKDYYDKFIRILKSYK